ncbi:hypothetical protein Taro_020988 [Colocasia esculenta]|uniref:Uncharacterized protein n=1 Tax=Colocasia esculenta TaxID=4460 RepID=A0A843V072_COLES|nr:hypothetical protein [Colocasia esculenta]
MVWYPLRGLDPFAGDGLGSSIGLTDLDEVFRHNWYQSKVRVNIRELERYIALFRNLKWLIEEIEVVEEMIQRRALSV